MEHVTLTPMTRVAGVLALIVVVTVTVAVGGAQQPQTPVFRGGVELVAVDVQVIDKSGQPMPALTPANFDVSINGKSRRVVSADFIRHAASAPGGPADAIAATLRPEAAAAGGATGRTIILAVDEHSFSAGAAQAAMQAAGRFLDHLEPNDRVGLYAYPTGASGFDLTRDHAAVRKSLDKVVGLLELPTSRFNLSSTEVIDITSADTVALDMVAERECTVGGVKRPNDSGCRRDIRMDAISIAGMLEIQVGQSIHGLHALLETLSRRPGRKILVVVSGGLLASDRPGGRPDLTMETLRLGEEAAAANTSLYGLHMDSSFIDAFSAGTKRGATSSLMRDSSVLGRGFERFTAAAGGTLIRVEAGTGDSAFAQVLRETSAFYLLAVEPTEADRDGKSHPIRVKVNARGATVRSRASVIIPKAGQ